MFTAARAPEGRVQAARISRVELKALLGAKKFEEYQEFLNKWTSAKVLGSI